MTARNLTATTERMPCQLCHCCGADLCGEAVYSRGTAKLCRLCDQDAMVHQLARAALRANDDPPRPQGGAVSGALRPAPSPERGLTDVLYNPQPLTPRRAGGAPRREGAPS
jgi:hypothetical protein